MQLLSRTAASARLKISTATFDRRRAEGVIPAPVPSIKKGHLRWRSEDIDAIADKIEVGGATAMITIPAIPLT